MGTIKKILSKILGQSSNKKAKEALAQAKQAQDIGNETIVDFQRFLREK